MPDTFYLSDRVVVRDVPAFRALSLAAKLTIPGIPFYAEEATTRIVRFAEAQSVVITGPGVFIYRSAPEGDEGEFILEVHLPVPGDTVFTEDSPTPGVPILSEVAPLRCAELSYRGPLQLIGEAYPHFIDRVRDEGHTPRNESREVYREWHGSDSPQNVIDLQIEID